MGPNRGHTTAHFAEDQRCAPTRKEPEDSGPLGERRGTTALSVPEKWIMRKQFFTDIVVPT